MSILEFLKRKNLAEDSTVSRLSANKGVFHVSSGDGAITAKKFFGFTVLEDTVITALTLNTTTDEVLSTNYLTEANLTGKTLKAGAFISCPEGTYITAITLSSGSVICYKFIKQ